MLRSAARPAEVARLHVHDVFEDQNVSIMTITDQGEGARRTKDVQLSQSGSRALRAHCPWRS